MKRSAACCNAARHVATQRGVFATQRTMFAILRDIVRFPLAAALETVRPFALCLCARAALSSRVLCCAVLCRLFHRDDHRQGATRSAGTATLGLPRPAHVVCCAPPAVALSCRGPLGAVQHAATYCNTASAVQHAATQSARCNMSTQRASARALAAPSPRCPRVRSTETNKETNKPARAARRCCSGRSSNACTSTEYP